MTRETLLQAVLRSHRRLAWAILVLTGANLLVLGLHQAWLSPRTAELQQEFIQSQARLREQRQREEAAGTERSGQEAVVRDLERFRAAIPPRVEFTELIGEIFGLAEVAGLGIEAINYRPEPLPESGLLQYTLTFSVAGDYERVKRFIHALEQSARLIVVEGIALTGSRPTGDEVDLRLRLVTYFRNGATP